MRLDCCNDLMDGRMSSSSSSLLSSAGGVVLLLLAKLEPGEWTVLSTFRSISAILPLRFWSSCSISELVSMVSALASFTSLLCISTLHFEFMGRG